MQSYLVLSYGFLSLFQWRRCLSFLVTLAFLLSCASSYGQQPNRKSSADYDIALWQSKVAEDPGYYGNYDKLTLSFIRKARETGDISYYDLAEKTLDAEKNNTHPDKSMLMSLMATIHFAKHEFSEAGFEAAEATKIDPENIAAFATVGDADLEQGEYADALSSYTKLSVYKPDDYLHSMVRYNYMSRMAHYSFISGHTPESVADLRQAIEIASALDLGKETPAWTQFILADELFMAGDINGAEQATKASLAHLSTYHRALSEMGKIRAAQGRFPEAIDYYKQAIAVIPVPIYVAALGDLYIRTGANAEAEKQFALVEFIGKLTALNKFVYNRELALFYADHDRKLPEALQLAEAEMKVRHDIYTWDTLAWTLFKNNQSAKAKDAIQKALQFQTQDAVLFFHAGMIYKASGEKQESKAYLEKALALNPQFHPIFADQARKTLAQGLTEGGVLESLEDPRRTRCSAGFEPPYSCL